MVTTAAHLARAVLDEGDEWITAGYTAIAEFLILPVGL
jgi:hypothetical protein